MFRFKANEPVERVSLWAREPMYFGLRVEPPANANRPLEGKEEEEPHRGPGVRSTWRTTGAPLLVASERSGLIIGPNGSGKSRKVLLPNLFRLANTSCVVVDIKGELAAHSALWRARQPGHRVMLLDPFRHMEHAYPRLFAKNPALFKSAGLNPVASLGSTGTLIDDCKALAAALIKSENSREPYFPLAAQAMIKGMLLGLRCHYGAAASLAHLRELLGLLPEQLADANSQMIEAYGAQCPALGASLGEFTHFSPEDRELGAIRRTAKVDTDFLDSPEIAADLNGPGFDAAALKETPATIYLVLPPEKLAIHGVWLRLVLTSLLLPLLRSTERASVPVLLMLDEFPALGHMPIIQDSYPIMRGYGVKALLVAQDLNQLKQLYRERFESFLSNAGVLMTFASQDVTTREYISRYSGERIIWHERKSDSLSHTSGNDVSVNRGSSTSDVHINERVVKPHELACLHADEAVVFVQGRYYCVTCPQPEFSEVAPHLAEARRAIED